MHLKNPEKKQDIDFNGIKQRHSVSAVVISYNRADIIETCLRALSFADELILVDKSSTDNTAQIAKNFATKIVIIPWSPTVEESREFAISQCKHDWILCLDDDECLSVEAIRFIQAELIAPRADVYGLPQRHYILGVHDEAAYYWPEHQIRFFRRDAIEFRSTVHGGTVVVSDAVYYVPFDTGICIHHLSHKSVFQWIEKTNRYTSRPDRLSVEHSGYDLVAFASGQIEQWASRSKTPDRGGYPAAVAVLRSLYDIIDRLKIWETEEGLDGEAAFKAVCEKLNAAYEAEGLGQKKAMGRKEATTLRASVTEADKPVHEQVNITLGISVRDIRKANDSFREQIETLNSKMEVALDDIQRLEAERLDLAEENETLRNDLDRVGEQLKRAASSAASEASRAASEASRAAFLDSQLEQVLNSRMWKMMAPARASGNLIRRRIQAYLPRLKLLVSALHPQHAAARDRLKTALLRRLNKELLCPPYAVWRKRFDTPGVGDIERIKADGAEADAVFVIAHFTAESAHLAARAAEVLKEQIGQRWQAYFSFSEECAREDIATYEMAASGDERFRLQLETGFAPEERILVFIRGGVIPRIHGLYALNAALVSNPSATVAYSDEDNVQASGQVEAPWFKPAFSPLLARQGVLLGGMVALRPEASEKRELFSTLSAKGKGAEEAIIDMALKAGEQAVVHIPHVLFHNAIPRPVPLPLPLPPLPSPLPVATVIIPTRDGWPVLGPCLESLKSTNWPKDRLEIIVVDNGSTDLQTLAGMETMEREGFIRILRDNRPFNYAALNNAAACAARGDLLVLLNNDTEVIDADWLRKLAAYAMQPGVGAVGPKLLYSDLTVQHGGVICGIQGVGAHAHLFLKADEPGYGGLANLTREVLAVTGACLAVRKELFEAAGGLREEFKVAFNDVVLCMDLYEMGRRNIYYAEPLFIHHESKTRGYDDTPEKKRLAREEAQLAWGRHAKLLRADPYYSPNLSLEGVHDIAFAPRRRPIWKKTRSRHSLKIMFLSSTYARGHGVAVVIDQQVRALLARGHEVILAGKRSKNDFSYEGIEVIEVLDPRIAAALAVDMDVDVIIPETPPYFSVARWTGAWPPVLAYDHGEPPPNFFPDAESRQAVNEEKNFAMAMTARVVAISEAVASEAASLPDAIIPNGNSHLGQWTPELEAMRDRVRREKNWNDRFVILDVCRFHAGERVYKGVDTYAETRAVLKILNPDLAARSVFVLCGKGDPSDIEAMRRRGLHVEANVTDAEMFELYAAADLYANFSRWEGYNLGIGQALAMGLPVVASDIPAHRAFGVPIAKDAAEAAACIVEMAGEKVERKARTSEWSVSLEKFVHEVEDLCEFDRRSL